jgi:putative flippase GtrA
MMFLLLLEHFFGWGVVICNLTALCISGTINFVMGEWVIFRRIKG